MVEVSNIKIYNLEEAIIACRNPMRTSPVSKIHKIHIDTGKESWGYNNDEFENSLKRAIQLAKTSTNSGHSNFLKGILVSYDLKYPQYFTKHLQRYFFNVYVSSSSIMHKLIEQNEENNYNEYVTENTKQEVERLINIYNNDKTEKNWMSVLSNCPMGLELFVHCTTNYMQLKNIYHQRKNHKLNEDWGAFCKFIESLPYFEEFIK